MEKKRPITPLSRYVHYGHRDAEARAANAEHQRAVRARRKAREALTPEERAEADALRARLDTLEQQAKKRATP